MTLATVALNRVGSIRLIDLVETCEPQGLDGLPYPFWRTERTPYLDSPRPDASLLEERFTDGDLRPFREWVASYQRADIWVTCRLNSFSADVPDMRILAYRADQLGFFASQRPDEDVVEIFKLSPLELGAAIAGSVRLTNPGRRPRITVPGFIENFMDTVDGVDNRDRGRLDDDDDDYRLSFRDVRDRGPATAVVSDYDDVTLMATVQSGSS